MKYFITIIFLVYEAIIFLNFMYISNATSDIIGKIHQIQKSQKYHYSILSMIQIF